MNSINDDILDYFDGPKQEKEKIVIGIDLGTSNSCASYWDKDHYIMIPNENNTFIFPSIISFDNSDHIYSCLAAKEYINNNNFFYETKRLIGRNYSDPFIVKEKKYLTYDINSDENDKIYISKTINDKTYKLTPEEVSGYILNSIKNSAENFLKQEVKDCVITVPAYFNESQKQATRNAAKIAGLNCVNIICEPVASAFAYGIIHKDNYKILVYDFGGGTLDVSLLKITDNIFEVIETSGNMHIGGLDFDKIIYNYCLSIFKQNNSDFKIKYLSNQKKKELLVKSELAKKELSDKINTTIIINDFFNNKELKINLSRSKFEELANNLLLLSMKPINKIFDNKTLTKDDIDEIILVGGMTRIPIIQRNIQNYFNKKPNTSMNPDYIVAIGAGIQGYLLSHPDAELSQSIILLNTTALSIGVEVNNEFMDVLIPRSTIIPSQVSRTYTNSSNDNSIKIKLFEGERKLTKDNYLIGEFSINVEPKPPGQHKINISVSIDLNNKINVKATNLLTNDEHELVINIKDKQLSETEIKNIIENANKYKVMDKMNKKIKKTKNYILSLIKNIEENKSKLSELHIDFNYSVIDIIKKEIDTLTLKDLREFKKLIEPIATIILTDDASLKLDESGNNNIMTSVNGNIIENDKYGTSVYQDSQLNHEKEINLDENIKKADNTEITQQVEAIETLCTEIMNYIDDMNINKNSELYIKSRSLSDYANDVLLYIHVNTDLTKEYLEKINNDLINKYTEIIDEYSKIYKLSNYSELIILCKSLQSILNIDDDTNDILTNQLKEIINNVLNEEFINEDKSLELINKIQNLSEEISKN